MKGMTSCRPPRKSNESEIKPNESEMDLINRQGAIDTAEAMHDRCDTLSVDDYRDMMVEALTVLPSANLQPNLQPTCNLATDCISRQDVMDEIARWIGYLDDDMINRIQLGLKYLPSAQPDLSGYSDRLWRAAYERGKAEAQAEIIKCKDCEWFRKEYGWNCIEYTVCKISPTHHPLRREEDFCSRAERKTDGCIHCQKNGISVGESTRNRRRTDTL